MTLDLDVIRLDAGRHVGKWQWRISVYGVLVNVSGIAYTTEADARAGGVAAVTKLRDSIDRWLQINGPPE